MMNLGEEYEDMDSLPVPGIVKAEEGVGFV